MTQGDHALNMRIDFVEEYARSAELLADADRSYQAITLVIMYQRPTRPARTKTSIPTFSQK